MYAMSITFLGLVGKCCGLDSSYRTPAVLVQTQGAVHCTQVLDMGQLPGDAGQPWQGLRHENDINKQNMDLFSIKIKTKKKKVCSLFGFFCIKILQSVAFVGMPTTFNGPHMSRRDQLANTVHVCL